MYPFPPHGSISLGGSHAHLQFVNAPNHLKSDLHFDRLQIVSPDFLRKKHLPHTSTHTNFFDKLMINR